MMKSALALALTMVGGTAPAYAECLTRPMATQNRAQESLTDVPVNMIDISSELVAEYEQLGYQRTSCMVENSSNIVRIDGCSISRLGNDTVKTRYTRLLGVDPARLCAASLAQKSKNNSEN
ncbi:hypothetical protein [Sphingobium yanoikuyae]|nr:hypothetical protein [Sphingobium yanoikuyae]